MFMGTPHMGSDLAQWGSTLARFSDLLRRTNAQITDVLKPGSEMLANLQQEFHLLLSARLQEQKKLEIYCFYEEVAVVGVGLVSQWLFYTYLISSIRYPSVSLYPYPCHPTAGTFAFTHLPPELRYVPSTQLFF